MKMRRKRLGRVILRNGMGEIPGAMLALGLNVIRIASSKCTADALILPGE
jgi:hypothetical protein